MESVFQSVSSAESNYFDIYIDGLDDQILSLQADQLNDIVQNISSQLSKATTRPLGLRLLNKFLDQCPAEVFNKTGNLWTSLAIKACHAQMQPNESSVAYEALGKIATKSLHFTELAKSFATGHISKIYESLNYVPAESAFSALRCLEICLRLYPTSSGPSRKIIEKFLSKFHDSLQHEIVLNNAKCLHLLQQVSGGGEVRSSSQKSNWKIYQTQLVGSIHAVFDEMFANCNEIWDDNVIQEQLALEKLDLSDEPVNRAAQLYVRFHNLLQYLIAALKEPYPTEKPILPRMLLGLIYRGLSVTSSLLHQNPITDNIALALLMPKVHIDLLQLLDAIVCILRDHLLPYYNLVLGLLMDILKSTSCGENNGQQKPFALLRSKIYESISLWCKIQNSASRCDVIAEQLINEILADITPEQNELTLQVCPGAGKHMSKKMKRQLHKAQNERSNISKTNTKAGKLVVAQKEDRRQIVCIAALRCLQELLLSIAPFMKPTKVRLLHTMILQICTQFYEIAKEQANLYSNAQCRLETFNALYVMVTTPHHLSPPPMDIILMILSNACCRDGNIRIRTHCNGILQNLEKLIHPQKESLVFPIDGRDIRNAFIILGQERLLADPLAPPQLIGEESDGDVEEALENGQNEIVKPLVNGNEVNIVDEDEVPKETNENNSPVVFEISDYVDVNESDNDEDCRIISPIKTSDGHSHIKLIDSENDEDCRIISPISNGDVNHEHYRDNQKSPDIILRVEEDCDSPLAPHVISISDGGNYLAPPANNIIVEEDSPSPKKARIEENTQKEDLDESLGMDDDQLLEDIASSFVDDLA